MICSSVKGIAKRAASKIRTKGVVTSGGMTAELTFGFWVKMLLPRHELVFWGSLHAAFPELPTTIAYADLYKRCDDVREFRNRVFHHEPILERNITLEYSQIIELIHWLSPDKGQRCPIAPVSNWSFSKMARLSMCGSQS